MKKFDFSSDIQLSKLSKQYSGVLNKIKEDKLFQKKLLILTIAIIFLIVITNLINMFQQGTIEEASSKQSEYQEIESFLTKYNNNANDYKNTVSKIRGQIIEFKDIDKASIIVSELATNNNLIINSNVKKEKTENIGNNIFAQDVDITITGEYGNILKFINGLENEQFFVSIDSLSITTNKDIVSSTITAKISYKIFFIKA